MRNILSSLLLGLLLALSSTASATFVRNMPVARIQPNGDTLHCFASGDEFYNWLHDANGFTIVRNPATGWFVYASRQMRSGGSDWDLVPTSLIPGVDAPQAAGLVPHLIKSPAQVDAMHKNWEIPSAYIPQRPANAKSSSTRNIGTINNIVIFIRFADDNEISTPFSDIYAMFNDSADNSVSMLNYFRHASYGKLDIPSYFLPTPSSNNVLSYQDTCSRNCFMPYDSTTNPSGYHDDTERRNLEFGLLERAVNYINSNYSLPSSLDIDYDNDGLVDNVCFVIKGSYTGWNDLLWPHKWAIYDRTVTLAGKRVYTFNFQLEGSGSHYFSASTFCHEMFHTLGSPDLYHYYNYTNANNVGSWDIMCSNTNPPQHMGMYMKMRYGNWVDSVTEITEAGTYSLHSVGDNEYSPKQCFRIQAGDPTQWYYLEYRDNSELFEQTLPGSGLIVYRIDPRYSGNANFDAVNIFDEVYIFNPGSHCDTVRGNIAQAFFSAQSGRTAFSPTTNPAPWLTGNVADTTFELANIGFAGDSITFTYIPHRPPMPACDSGYCTLLVTMEDQMADTWNGSYLDFSTLSGNHVAYLSMGDCKETEVRAITVPNEPIRVNFIADYASEECSFSIAMGDGTPWTTESQPSTSFFVGSVPTPCGPGPRQLFSLTVDVAPQCQNMGSVSGSGEYYDGDTATLTASPYDGFAFDYWQRQSDMQVTSINPLNTAVLASDTYLAYFKSTTGLSTADNKPLIFTKDNTAFIRYNAGASARIIDIQGRTVVNATLSGNDAFPLPHPGVYFILIDNLPAQKIAIVR